MRRRLPVLPPASPARSNIPPLPIADPCQEDWEAMDEARGHRRFCGSCSKHVHHLSAMTRAEAEQFVRAHAGENVCVRYAKDHAGQIVFRPTAAPAPSRKMAAVAIPVLAFALAACTPHGQQDAPDLGPDEPVEHLQGALAVVPDQPEVVEVMGEAPILEEPCEKPEVEPVDPLPLKGKVAVPRPVVLTGDVAIPRD